MDEQPDLRQNREWADAYRRGEFHVACGNCGGEQMPAEFHGLIKAVEELEEDNELLRLLNGLTIGQWAVSVECPPKPTYHVGPFETREDAERVKVRAEEDPRAYVRVVHLARELTDG